MSGWQVRDAGERFHVVPVDDTTDHALTGQCWCAPTLDDNVWVHHSQDGREANEDDNGTVSANA